MLKWKSPFEIIWQNPSLIHLRVVGCLCFATSLTKKEKFSPRAVRVVLVGYSAHQKRYKLYDLENKIIFVSRDVVFMKTMFPFKGSIEDQDTHTVHPQQVFSYEELSTTSDLTQEHSQVVVPTAENLIDAQHLYESPLIETTILDINPFIAAEPTGVSELRRSTRGSKPPSWHKDYVVRKGSNNFLFSIADQIDYTSISTTY